MRVSKLRSSFAVWLATGIITAGTSVLIHHRLYYRTIPNRLLANIKAGFANRGTIENSWIQRSCQSYSCSPTNIQKAIDYRS